MPREVPDLAVETFVRQFEPELDPALLDYLVPPVDARLHEVDATLGPVVEGTEGSIRIGSRVNGKQLVGGRVVDAVDRVRPAGTAGRRTAPR